MNTLTAENINSVKAQGFLRNRGSDCFSGRVVAAAGVFTAPQLGVIAHLADTYGNGKIAFTTRLTAEIVGIPFHQIQPAQDYLAGCDCGLVFGGTGAKIRPITACKGTTCVFGCSDTQGLAAQLHQEYYFGRADLVLPHKFKIGIGGCQNSCMKPSLNDFGIEARRQKDGVRYQIYLGGTWGRVQRPGTPLSQLITEEQITPVLDAVLTWFQQNASPKERLGAAIDRLGMDQLEQALSL